MCDDRAQETVNLEFKRKQDPTRGTFSESDKKSYGKALSGLANSQGGMLVWGVVAARNADGVDCVSDLQPIAEIEKFEADARNLAGEFLMPRHDGITVTRIPPSKPDTGYLVVYVERSERRPHISKAPADGRYYRRAGSSTFPMEHGDIEDAFSRRSTPHLNIAHRWRQIERNYSAPGDQSVLAILEVGIDNPSETLARFPYLNIRLSPSSVGSHSQSLHYATGVYGLKQRDVSNGWFRFVGGADDVIPPEEALWVTKFVVTLRWDHSEQAFTAQNRPAAETFIRFEYRLGCESSRSSTGLVISKLATLSFAGFGPL